MKLKHFLKPYVHLFELWFSQGICPVVGFLDHMVILLSLILWLVFLVPCPQPFKSDFTNTMKDTFATLKT